MIGGGVIPDEDIRSLKATGVAEVFTPGTRIADIAAFIRSHVQLSELSRRGGVTRCSGRSITSASSFRASPKRCRSIRGRLVSQSVHEEVIADQRVQMVFVPVGEIELELLEPIDGQSARFKWLEKRGPGIHHIAYRVEMWHRRLSREGRPGLRLDRRDAAARRTRQTYCISASKRHVRRADRVLSDGADGGDVPHDGG